LTIRFQFATALFTGPSFEKERTQVPGAAEIVSCFPAVWTNGALLESNEGFLSSTLAKNKGYLTDV